jgi:TolA-binding protein
LAKKLDELRQSKETVAQRDAQLKALRRDMESMRKQLEDRDKQIRTLKAKKVSSQQTKKKKAQVAAP